MHFVPHMFCFLMWRYAMVRSRWFNGSRFSYVNQNEPWRLNKELRKLRKLQQDGQADEDTGATVILQHRLDTVLCLSMHAARISSK